MTMQRRGLLPSSAMACLGPHATQRLVNSLSQETQTAVEQRLCGAVQLRTAPFQAAECEKSRVEKFRELTSELIQLLLVSSQNVLPALFFIFGDRARPGFIQPVAQDEKFGRIDRRGAFQRQLQGFGPHGFRARAHQYFFLAHREEIAQLVRSDTCSRWGGNVAATARVVADETQRG